jgi:hypothetical protein
MPREEILKQAVSLFLITFYDVSHEGEIQHLILAITIKTYKPRTKSELRFD